MSEPSPFRTGIPAEPGQFIMLTDFKGGEKPFSISDHGSDFLSVTVKRIGEFTNRLFTLKKGDPVSIRGAYGSSFFIPGKAEKNHPGADEFRPVLCGGGYGTPPLFFLTKALVEAGVPAHRIRIISAGRTEEDLLFEERFRDLGVLYIGVTEENRKPGVFRFRGYRPQTLWEDSTGTPTAEGNFLYASGSDLMMKSLLSEYPEDLDYQFLFERYMKCAIGICWFLCSRPSGNKDLQGRSGPLETSG